MEEIDGSGRARGLLGPIGMGWSMGVRSFKNHTTSLIGELGLGRLMSREHVIASSEFVGYIYFLSLSKLLSLYLNLCT